MGRRTTNSLGKSLKTHFWDFDSHLKQGLDANLCCILSSYLPHDVPGAGEEWPSTGGAALLLTSVMMLTSKGGLVRGHKLPQAARDADLTALLLYLHFLLSRLTVSTHIQQWMP